MGVHFFIKQNGLFIEENFLDKINLPSFNRINSFLYLLKTLKHVSNDYLNERDEIKQILYNSEYKFIFQTLKMNRFFWRLFRKGNKRKNNDDFHFFKNEHDSNNKLKSNCLIITDIINKKTNESICYKSKNWYKEQTIINKREKKRKKNKK